MKCLPISKPRGFTLIELLTALLILSLVALMSYRGLTAVIDARDYVTREADKWRRVASFFTRFESDIRLAMPVAAPADADAPVWLGERAGGLTFERFAAADDMSGARRLAYRLNAKNEIELWLWPPANAASAARYPVLSGVSAMAIDYLGTGMAWLDSWPQTSQDRALPLAVRITITLDTGEQITRVYAMPS